MINDEYGVLSGLFRECDKCITIYKGVDFFIRHMTFYEKTVILKERLIKGDMHWHIYDSSDNELMEEEIINLYAESNLKRQLDCR